MNETILFKSVLVSVAFIFFIKILFTNIIKSSKIKQPPSPPALPILGHLHLLKPPLHQALIGISNRYGPITFLRFGSRPAVVISSAKLAEECFTANDLAFANRVHLPTVMLPDLILMANYGPYWRNVRQIAAVELLSNQKLQASSDIRACEIRDTARQLFQSYVRTKKMEGQSGFEKVQVKTFLFNLLLNVTMMMIAGTRLCRDSMENMEEMKRYKEAIWVWFELSGGRIIEDFFPILKMLDLRGVMKRLRDATDVNEMMVKKLINEHRQGAEKRNTMIARMLELQKEDPEKYSDLVIQNICITLLLGGTETSATTIQWAMANLLNNPDILKRATLEIDDIVGHERLIQESDMANLPYLHHIINETLRMFPAGPLLAPHESSKEVTVGGYEIPSGTMLLVNIYHIQRSPEIWNEPTKFEPERFERGDYSGAKWMIPFGMGRRKCPGEALAMREIGMILGTLIQCFDWERVGGKPVDMTEADGMSLAMAVPLEALYRPRQAMVKVLSEL